MISIQVKIHDETEVKTAVTVPMKLQEVTKKSHEKRMLKSLKRKNLVSASAGSVYPGKKPEMTFCLEKSNGKFCMKHMGQ